MKYRLYNNDCTDYCVESSFSLVLLLNDTNVSSEPYHCPYTYMIVSAYKSLTILQYLAETFLFLTETLRF